MPPIIGAIGSLLATLGGGSAAAGAAALGGLASSGVGIGETIAHSGTPQMPQITTPSTAPVTTPPPAPINPATIAQVGANTQYNTGGGTSPDYLQALIAQLNSSPPGGA